MMPSNFDYNEVEEQSSDIGTRMRHIRMVKNLRQKEVADEVAVSLSHYSKVEVGINRPSVSMLERFCTAFEVNPEWLATGEGKPFSSVGEESAAYGNELLSGERRLPDAVLEDIAGTLAEMLADVSLDKIRKSAAELDVTMAELLKTMILNRLSREYGECKPFFQE